MNAILNTQIHYENGYITIIESLSEPMDVSGAELIENNCKGWAESNSVVRFDENYYLATIKETL